MNPFDKQNPIEGIKKIIVIGSGKGGVGKSTVTVNLASALKAKGLRVGILDADIYGPSLPRMLGALDQAPAIDEQKKLLPLERLGLKLMSIGFLIPQDQAVVWRGPMLFKAIEQFFRDVLWGELDFLLIDLPPGTGDVALTIAQKVPVDGAITVCTPQNLALADAKRAVDMFNRIKVPLLGVVENMSGFYDSEQDKLLEMFPRGEFDQYMDSQKIKQLCRLHFDPKLALSSESGFPIVESDKQNPLTAKFLELSEQVINCFK